MKILEVCCLQVGSRFAFGLLVGDLYGKGNPMAIRLNSNRKTTRGFTLVELMIGMTILAFGLLAVAGMFQTGFTDVSKGGKATMAATAARQTLENLRSIPFNSLVTLYTNGVACNPPTPCLPPYTFSTASSYGTLQGNQQVKDVIRQLRYALNGDDGTGNWNFTAAEKNQWSTMLGPGGTATGGTATITIADATQGAGRVLGLMDVTVRVTMPGTGLTVQFGTRINR